MPKFVVATKRVICVERTIEAETLKEARRLMQELDLHDFALDGDVCSDDVKLVSIKQAVQR